MNHKANHDLYHSLSWIPYHHNLLKHNWEQPGIPNIAKGYTTNDKDMNFKQPIDGNQETKNWVSKDTQIIPSNPETRTLNNQ